MAALVLSLLLLAMAGHSSASWCVCKTGLSDSVLQKTLDWACGNGADCNPVKPKQSCFNPDNVRSHCNYAVNSFYQKKGQSSGSCDFSGTATPTNTDPSYTGCPFPSSTSGSSGSSGSSTGTPSTNAPKALQSAYHRIKPRSLVENFSFLREIKEGKCFDLVCKILHIYEDMGAIFVWDGTDAPPASIMAKGIEDDKAFRSLSVHNLLSRDILLSFPTVGTILRVSLSTHLFYQFKPGDWVKIYHLLCEVDKGSWVGKATNSTEVHLAQDDRLVEKIMRVYDKRISSKFGCIPFWSFPSPPGLTETDDGCAPFVSLMDIITFPKVTCKYKCIVRVVSAYPWQVEDFFSGENRLPRVLLTLEDPTTTLEAFLCDKEAEYFWGLGFQDTEMLRKKRNRVLGIWESSNNVATRNPPWIECCILSYYTRKDDPWNTRSYRIFGTRLLD